jgi:hypothetical protein
MNTGDWNQGAPILAEWARLNALLQKPVYTAADKTKIIASLKALGLGKKDDGGEYAILRQNRGRLVKRPVSGPMQVVARGRGDWVGWVELKVEAVNETATRMTAKVIDEMDADVLAVIEAEDRIALMKFHDQLLAPLNARYRSAMLIDGNDERGIDVGLLTKTSYPIESIVSHVDDSNGNGNGRIFSRESARSTTSAARKASAASRSWATSTTCPAATRSSRCSARAATCATCSRTPSSSATAGPAPSATARRARSSTTCCSRRPCGTRSRPRRCTARASGAARTARSSRTIPR